MLFNDETQNLFCGLPVAATPGTLRRVKSQATDFKRPPQRNLWGFFALYPYVYPSWTRGLSSEQAGIDRIKQVKCDIGLIYPKFRKNQGSAYPVGNHWFELAVNNI